MSTIGRVQKQKDGTFTGHVKTMSMERPIFITVVPLKGPKLGDKHPDYRIMAGKDSECGAGWNKKSKEKGNAYVSLTLEAPEFGAKKLYCNLGHPSDDKDPNVFNLIWNAQR